MTASGYRYNGGEMSRRVVVVGGGLAGSEAAWQLARRNVPVELVEMRPAATTAVHRTGNLAELVCSNSLRGNSLDQAAGLLKEEMRRMGSLIVATADEVRVPAGSALAVDRDEFAERVSQTLEAQPLVTIRRVEMRTIPQDEVVVLATGPLTSDTLAADLAAFVGQEQLYFFDAISPIVEADSIDMSRAFRASRYNRGGEDYINCPLTVEQYRSFYEALVSAECVTPREFERELFFEGCLPVEIIARRGPETLLFGPLKPVGLEDPRTGRRPFAVVQLRQDNLAASHYSLVGFQTHLRWNEQKRVFRMIPALAEAEFVRYGMIHRNTYINAPTVIQPTFETRRRPGLFVAGQVSGVEGYIESAASGLVAGIGAAFRFRGQEPPLPPPETALGALGHYAAHSDPAHYQPSNIAFGLLPSLPGRIRDKARKRLALAHRALESLEPYRAVAACDADPEAQRAATSAG
jgi:methylenetetrahydrofolate--tRNA-(uracil-5-)-methyltransferase